MEYIYAALLLHNAGKAITEEAITAVLQAAGIEVNEARAKGPCRSPWKRGHRRSYRKGSICKPCSSKPHPQQPHPQQQKLLPKSLKRRRRPCRRRRECRNSVPFSDNFNISARLRAGSLFFWTAKLCIIVVHTKNNY